MTEPAVRYLMETGFDAAIRFGLLALVAEMLTRRLRTAAPALVHAAWIVVLAAAVVMPAAGAVTPGEVFVRPGRSLSALAAAVQPSAILSLGTLCLAGTLVGFARVASGLALVRRLRRTSVPVSGDEYDAPLREAGRWSRRTRRTVFLENGRLSLPVTIGYVRPCIILPDGWRGWPAARLEAVLAHELAHVERGDYPTGLVARIIQAVWWWHPAAWLTVSRLSLCAELAADARATRDRDPAEYASDLITLAAASGGRRVHYAWTPGATSKLSARVDALLAAAAGRDPAPAGAPLAVAVVLVAAVAACAAGSIKLTPFRDVQPPATDRAAFDHTALHQARHSGH
jgi:beta-lactamase regulating signal transducer with metallopeptidase domain